MQALLGIAHRVREVNAAVVVLSFSFNGSGQLVFATSVEVFFSSVCLVKSVNFKLNRVLGLNVLFLALLASELPSAHAGFITYAPSAGGTFEPGVTGDPPG